MILEFKKFGVKADKLTEKLTDKAEKLTELNRKSREKTLKKAKKL